MLRPKGVLRLAGEAVFPSACGRMCVCTDAIRGCSHVCEACGVVAAALCVYAVCAGLWGTFWPPASPLPYQMLSLARASALLSLGQMIFLSATEELGCVCGGVLGRNSLASGDLE
jgi:hypothetical protein